MRGVYARKITSEPGTCGGCLHFRRYTRDGRPTATGKCKAKPGVWSVSQTRPACKTHYTADGDETQSALDTMAALPRGTVGCGTCAFREDCEKTVSVYIGPGTKYCPAERVAMEILFCSAYRPEETEDKAE